MNIKTKYYYHNKGKFFEFGGYMVLEERTIKQLGEQVFEGKGKSFYSNESKFDITCQNNDQNYKVDINAVITEASYNTSQKEYFVKLTWLQKQQLKWMFKRHWIQQPENKKHVFLFLVFIALALVVLYFFTNKLQGV
jgi:hypothetical protein